MKISLHIIVLIVRGSFHRTHGWKKIFLLLMRALLMLNYDKPSRIFPCMLLTRNHMIFLVQFGINKQLLIFSKHQRVIRLSYERYPFLANFSIAIRCNGLEILTLNFYKTIWNSNIDHMGWSILEQDVCIHGKGLV